MDITRKIATALICVCFAISINSCSISMSTRSGHHDNGKHKGWFKNPKNPHHPSNPGPGNGKTKKNKK